MTEQEMPEIDEALKRIMLMPDIDEAQLKRIVLKINELFEEEKPGFITAVNVVLQLLIYVLAQVEPETREATAYSLLKKNVPQAIMDADRVAAEITNSETQEPKWRWTS